MLISLTDYDSTYKHYICLCPVVGALGVSSSTGMGGHIDTYQVGMDPWFVAMEANRGKLCSCMG